MTDLLIMVIVLIMGLPYAYLVGRAVGMGFHSEKHKYHNRFLERYAIWSDDENDDNDNNQIREGNRDGGTVPRPQQRQQWAR